MTIKTDLKQNAKDSKLFNTLFKICSKPQALLRLSSVFKVFVSLITGVYSF